MAFGLTPGDPCFRSTHRHVDIKDYWVAVGFDNALLEGHVITACADLGTPWHVVPLSKWYEHRNGERAAVWKLGASTWMDPGGGQWSKVLVDQWPSQRSMTKRMSKPKDTRAKYTERRT